MSTERKVLDTIHEKDLTSALKKIGLLEKIQNQQLKCKFCNQIITLENLYSVIPESGSFNVVCDSPACISQFHSYLTEKHRTKQEDTHK